MPVATVGASFVGWGMTEDEKIRGAWEVSLYARDLLAKRMSYGMIAQSMLLIAFATLAAGRACSDVFTAYFQILVASLGLILTVYQYFRVYAIQRTLWMLEREYFTDKDLVFSHFLRMTGEQKVPRNVSQQAILIVFLGAWCLFLLGAIFLEPPSG